ncbi:hypothetical protein D9M68_871270 [compost metagenome]
MLDVDVVAHDLHQVGEAEPRAFEHHAQPPEGPVGLFRGALGHAAVGTQADLPRHEQQAAGLDAGRVLEGVEDGGRAEGRMAVGNAHALFVHGLRPFRLRQAAGRCAPSDARVARAARA